MSHIDCAIAHAARRFSRFLVITSARAIQRTMVWGETQAERACVALSWLWSSAPPDLLALRELLEALRLLSVEARLIGIEHSAALSSSTLYSSSVAA